MDVSRFSIADRPGNFLKTSSFLKTSRMWARAFSRGAVAAPGRDSLLAADLPSCIALHRLEWVGQAWREGPETREGTGGWDP